MLLTHYYYYSLPSASLLLQADSEEKAAKRPRSEGAGRASLPPGCVVLESQGGTKTYGFPWLKGRKAASIKEAWTVRLGCSPPALATALTTGLATALVALAHRPFLQPAPCSCWQFHREHEAVAATHGAASSESPQSAAPSTTWAAPPAVTSPSGKRRSSSAVTHEYKLLDTKGGWTLQRSPGSQSGYKFVCLYNKKQWRVRRLPRLPHLAT